MKKSLVILALVCLPIFIGTLDLTVVSAVLPHVIYDLEIPLQTGLDEAAWLVSGYLLAYSIAMTFMGHLSDLLGRRKVYLFALAIFGLGSYLVAAGQGWPTRLGMRMWMIFLGSQPDPARLSLLVLIAARMIQAFGGGAMVPVGMALAGDLYPPGQRGKALGVIAAVDTAGWVVGHLYGGVIVRYFDWRTIFWLNLPVCLLAFTLIAVAMTGLPRPPVRGQMDWIGALLISACLAALNLGLGTTPETRVGLSSETASQGSGFSLPLLIAAVLLLALFLWRQSRASFPLIPLSLFRRPNFASASLANFLVGVGLFIAIANVPLFINTLVAATLEQGAWDSGWMLSALTVPMALASLIGGWLTARSGYRVPAVLGLLGALAGFAWMAGWQASTPYRVMLPHLALAGVGFGLSMAPIATAAVNTASASQRGTASGLVIIFRLIGMTVGISGMTTYGIQRANALSERLLPASASLAEITRIGMQVAETVIHETFWIAASVCILALLPVLLLRNSPTERSSL